MARNLRREAVSSGWFIFGLVFCTFGTLGDVFDPQAEKNASTRLETQVATGTPYIKRLRPTFRNVGYPHFGTWDVL